MRQDKKNTHYDPDLVRHYGHLMVAVLLVIKAWRTQDRYSDELIRSMLNLEYTAYGNARIEALPENIHQFVYGSGNAPA